MTFSIRQKNGFGKKKSTIAMLGPLLAMPSGQGQNMSFLAILKVNLANWLLVLEKKLELGKKFLLLTRYHYWLDNIIRLCIHSYSMIIVWQRIVIGCRGSMNNDDPGFRCCTTGAPKVCWVGWSLSGHRGQMGTSFQWEFQDPIHGGTSVPYKAIFCGDIPWNLGLKNSPYLYIYIW